jgi:murein DD-endopeptidase / murein LD-carboxypeptidase
MPIDHALRARALVGTRFRPQGRSAHHGLDCVGLVMCVFGIQDTDVRRDYRLRGDHRLELIDALSRAFRRVAPSQRRAGDILLMQIAPDQFHLAINTVSGFVHADARIGRVVETPGHPAWPIIAAFRPRARKQRQG